METVNYVALTPSIITKGRHESIVEKISNPKYFGGTAAPNGARDVAVYYVANYFSTLTEQTILTGRPTAISAEQAAQTARSCVCSNVLPINKFFNAVEYQALGIKGIEEELLDKLSNQVRAKFNKSVLGLVKTACDETGSGVLLNPYQANGSSGADAAEYALFPAPAAGASTDYRIDLTGLNGQELYAAITTAYNKFTDKEANAGIVTSSDIMLVCNSTLLSNLKAAGLLILTPNVDAYGLRYGMIDSLGLQVISASLDIAKDDTNVFNFLCTKDAFAFNVMTVEPMNQYKEASVGSYIGGTGYTATYKYGFNIADKEKIYVLTTGINDTVAFGATNVNVLSQPATPAG